MSATSPAVSVILPTYNRARLLPRSIASVLGQSWTDFELLVVDDMSTDDTERVVRSFNDKRLVLIRSPKNGGDAAARNLGASRARGTWLAFQDSDDEWLPGKLQRQMEYAQELLPDCAAVGSTVLRFVGDAVEVIRWPLSGDQDKGEVARERFIAGFTAYLQSLIIRRTAFEAVGGFDTRIRARSDFELCLRLLQTYRFNALSAATALSYETADGISMRPDYRRADIRYILDQHSSIIDANRAAKGRYYYDLARAEFDLGNTGVGRRMVIYAVISRPQRLLAWVLLAASFSGAAGVRWLTKISQAVRRGRGNG